MGERGGIRSLCEKKGLNNAGRKRFLHRLKFGTKWQCYSTLRTDSQSEKNLFIEWGEKWMPLLDCRNNLANQREFKQQESLFAKFAMNTHPRRAVSHQATNKEK